MDYDAALKLSELENSLKKIEERIAEINREVSWIEAREKKDDKKILSAISSSVSPLRENAKFLSESLVGLKKDFSSFEAKAKKPHEHGKILELLENFDAIKKKISKLEKISGEPHSHAEMEKISSAEKSISKFSSGLAEAKKKVFALEGMIYELVKTKAESREIEKKFSALSSDIKSLRSQIDSVASEAFTLDGKASKKISELESRSAEIFSEFESLKKSFSYSKSAESQKLLEFSKSFQKNFERLSAEISILKSQIAMAYGKSEKAELLHEKLKEAEAKISALNEKISEALSSIAFAGKERNRIENKISDFSLALSVLKEKSEKSAPAEDVGELRNSIATISSSLQSFAAAKDFQSVQQALAALRAETERLSSETGNFAKSSELSQMLERVESAETDLESLFESAGEIKNFKAELAEQKNISSETAEKISSILSEIDKSFSNAEAMKTEIEELKNLKSSTANLQEEISAMEGALTEVRRSFSDLNERVEKSVPAVEGKIDSIKIIFERDLEKLKSSVLEISKRAEKMESEISSFAKSSEFANFRSETASRILEAERSAELAENSIREISEEVEKLNSEILLLAKSENLENLKSEMEKNISSAEEKIAERLSSQGSKISEASKSIGEIRADVLESRENAEKIASALRENFALLSNAKTEELRKELRGEILIKAGALEEKIKIAEKLGSEIESARLESRAEVAEIKEKINSLLAEKYSTEQSLSEMEEKILSAEAELKKLNFVSERLSTIEGAGTEGKMESLSKSFSEVKASLEESLKKIEAEGSAFKKKNDELESRLAKLNLAAIAASSPRKEKISLEGLAKSEEIKKFAEDLHSLEKKLAKLEEHDMMIFKNISENMRILRDWSQSVEARLHASEAERKSDKFFAEKISSLEERLYKMRR